MGMQNETLPERIDTFVKPYMVNDRTYSTCDASAMALLNEAASVIRRLEGDRDAAWKMARAAAEGHDRLRLEFSEQGHREAGMVRELESLRALVKLAESDRDLHKQEIAAVRGAPSTISKLKAERDAFAEAATVALADADLARAEQKDLRDHLAAAEQRIHELKEALAILAPLEAEVQAFVSRLNRTGQKRHTLIRAVAAAPSLVNAGEADPVAGP